MQTANRVFFNTGILYGQMLLTIAITLFSSRIVLNALGAVNYGIFNLISGVILLLAFLNAAMTVSTQRYLSYYLGSGFHEKLQMVFNTSVVLHLILGIFICGFLLIVGIFLFDNVLNIPAESKESAVIIFHFMVCSTFFTIISVPYDAILNSHENMITVAIIEICNSIIRLGIAVSLIHFPGDKLIFYGACMAGLTIIVVIIKRLYCHLKYSETKILFKKFFSKGLFKEMFAFSGWNFFGSFSMLAKNQGIAVILNTFFGARINASYAIANQVDSQLKSFSTYMLKALNPQIAISEGSGERKRMLNLAMIASKFAFLLMSFFAIPLLIEMPYVLTVWLKNVPEYTIGFCNLILVVSLINLLSVGIQSAVQSVGRIKKYQIGVSILLILNLPFAYILLRMGLLPTTVLCSTIIIEIFAFVFRLLAVNRLANMPIKEYLNYVVFKPLLIVLICMGISIIPHFFFNEGFIRLLITIAVSSISFLLFTKLLGLSKYENEKINKILKDIFLSILHKFDLK
ncbi:MAG: MATE family efflux transporter [Bacteroidales bacterium]|nr:MATE family efflux transporter [Bacteroidales bacterium]